jgi:hypothetical protein
MSAQFKYRDLLAQLQAMTPEQLNCDVTLQDVDGEVYPAALSFWDEFDDRLDPNHPVICVSDD